MEATFTVHAVTKDGFLCTLTLSDSSTKDLMIRALSALTWLRENGFEPPVKAPAQPQPTEAAKPAPVLPDGTPDPAWCPVHQVAMSRREKDGQVWYSHKLPDGSYCRGKPPKGDGR